MRKLDIELEKEKIITFIKRYISSSGLQTGIIGISGGIDSAVVADLTLQALGKDNIFGVMLPYKNSSPNSIEDAQLLVKKLDIRNRIIDITPMVDAWFDNNEPDASLIRRGNFIARMRMSVLYDLSAKENALVIGTGNLSELLTGYSTQYGDNACAFEPIGHLYKTEVKQLAETLDIPHKIIDKNPSADLWPGQTDESELGIPYSVLDELLYFYLIKKNSKQDLIDIGFSEAQVERMISLYNKSMYKRKMPPTIDDWS